MRVARLPTIIAVLMGSCLWSATVGADDRAECNRMLADARIAGCTQLIENRRLSAAERAAAYFERGRGYLSKTRGEQLAIADFEEAMRLASPGSAESLVYRAYQKMARREFGSAVTSFDEAVSRKPDHALALHGRAIAYRMKGDLVHALANYDAAVRLDPGNAGALAGRALVASAQRDHARAIVDFDAAIKLDATYASALRGRGLAKLELGRLDDAIVDFNEAIRHDPELALAYNGRGFTWLKKGDKDRALSDFDAAIRLDPALIVAYVNRGNIRAGRGEVALAMADYQRVLTLPTLGASDRGRVQFAREKLAQLKSPATTKGKAVAAVAHRRVALVIGNSRYRAVAELPNPVNDAKGMAASLRRLGFEHVVELLNATRSQMSDALKSFGDVSQGAEWSVLFFAGHGMEINGTSYLIPVDALLKSDAHVEDEAISLPRVMAKVDGARRMGLVILDACRNNPFGARMARSRGATRSLEQGLAPVEPDGNVMVAYAAKHGTTAADGLGTHSPYTEALLAHIEEPGLEINLLFRKVRDRVRRQTDLRQTPFEYGSLGSDPIYFR